MKNIKVIKAWLRNETAKTKRLVSDGIILRSYNKAIGHTVDDVKYIVNYTAQTIEGKEGFFLSQTTSTHVRMAYRMGCVKVLSPDEADSLIRVNETYRS